MEECAEAPAVHTKHTRAPLLAFGATWSPSPSASEHPSKAGALPPPAKSFGARRAWQALKTSGALAARLGFHGPRPRPSCPSGRHLFYTPLRAGHAALTGAHVLPRLAITIRDSSASLAAPSSDSSVALARTGAPTTAVVDGAPAAAAARAAARCFRARPRLRRRSASGWFVSEGSDVLTCTLCTAGTSHSAVVASAGGLAIPRPS